MQRPTNLKVGDRFRVTVRDNDFNIGEIISLRRDDSTESPWFWKEDKSDYYCIHFYKLEPYKKTAERKKEIMISLLAILYNNLGYFLLTVVSTAIIYLAIKD